MPDDMAAIAKFQEAINDGCLDPIGKHARVFNCFEVLRIAETEIRHSNVLAWLLDPHENHGLGSAVLEQFLKYLNEELIPSADELAGELTSEIQVESFNNFAVHREWHNVDILIAAKDGSLKIAIENKVRSGEHDDQLNRYYDLLKEEAQLGGAEVRFIYLTPEGESPSDPEHWIPMSYESVVEIIEHATEDSNIAPETQAFINHYLEAVRSRIMHEHVSRADKDLEEACSKIYKDHKHAIDLIVQYIPDRTAEVRKWLWEWAEKSAEQKGLIFDDEHSRANLLKFTSASVSKILPPTPNCQSTWRSNYHYYFELDNRNSDCLFMWFVLNGKSMSDQEASEEFQRQLDLFARIENTAINSTKNEFNRRKGGKTEGWEYRCYCRTLKVSLYDVTTQEDVLQALDILAEEVQASTEKLLGQALVEHESSLA